MSAIPPPGQLTATRIVSYFSENPVPLPAGEYLFREGDEPRNVYYIEEGSLKIFRTLHGEELLLDIYQAGAIIGEVPLLRASLHLASARAVGHTVLHCLNPTRFWELMGSDPAFRQHMLTNMQTRSAELDALSEFSDNLKKYRTLADAAAHEINNPASAVSRLSQGMEEDLAALVDQMASQNGLPDALKCVLRDQPEEQNPDPLRKMEDEQLWQEKLDELDMPESWVLAGRLAAHCKPTEAMVESLKQAAPEALAVLPRLLRLMDSNKAIGEAAANILEATANLKTARTDVKASSFFELGEASLNLFKPLLTQKNIQPQNRLSEDKLEGTDIETLGLLMQMCIDSLAELCEGGDILLETCDGSRHRLSRTNTKGQEIATARLKAIERLATHAGFSLMIDNSDTSYSISLTPAPQSTQHS